MIVIALFVGLASRKFPHFFPAFLAEYLGDTLWALLIFLLMGFLFARKPSFNLAIGALIFSYVIEISQLYHDSWIDSIRNTTFGALILGHGFLWSDILCYTVGIACGYLIELFVFSYFLQHYIKTNIK